MQHSLQVGMNRRLLDGPGAVDIYAFDSYPFAYGCENPEEWSKQVNEEYLPFFDDTAGKKGQPYFIVGATILKSVKPASLIQFDVLLPFVSLNFKVVGSWDTTTPRSKGVTKSLGGSLRGSGITRT